MRQLTLTAKSNIFHASPSGSEDYVYSIDVDPVQTIASIRIGMRVVLQNEFGSVFGIGLECKGKQVTVTFADKALRTVTFCFGRYLPCSPRGEVCVAAGLAELYR